MARPLKNGISREVVLNTKLSEDENNQLKEIVRNSGMSKSELLRKTLYITFKKAREVQKRVQEQTKKLLKDGNFSIDAITTMTKMYEDELEKELNKMAYDGVVENKKKKNE